VSLVATDTSGFDAGGILLNGSEALTVVVSVAKTAIEDVGTTTSFRLLRRLFFLLMLLPVTSVSLVAANVLDPGIVSPINGAILLDDTATELSI
jgi:hypothetical protein